MIRRPQFERLWSDSSGKEKYLFKKYLDAIDKKKIIIWIKEHPSLELGEKQLVELKSIANRLGIRNYSRLGKLDLIRVIMKEENYASQ